MSTIQTGRSSAPTPAEISPDDQLTLLTDGVLEARKSNGELFGFARTESISVQSVTDIAHAAEGFGQEDDITVLSLTRRAPVEKLDRSTEPSEWLQASA